MAHTSFPGREYNFFRRHNFFEWSLVGAGYIIRRITTQVDVLNFSELNSTLKLYIRDYR
jgi:hypothetical protein